MRIILFLVFVSILFQPVIARAQTKQDAQHQLQQGIDEMKKQIADLEKQIVEAKRNKEDAETIKQMETRLIIFKKQLENFEGMSKEISNTSENASEQSSNKTTVNSVPERDDARINMLPKRILSDADLVPYLKNIVTEVEKKIPASYKAKALELYNETMKSKNNSPKVLGNIASACWMNGYPEMALYIMGKACLSDMTDGNNLNNYAAFLIMEGGDHAALPILQNLNAKFPNNSTILNNIGQAWYGLGEMNNTNRYLDSSMHFYSLHSQANQTKATIQKSEGKTQESIESLKRSIKENYTPEKEARLNELGGKLEYNDITFPYPAKAEPLGIEKFIFMIPAYPFEGGIIAEINRIEWDDFKEKVFAALEKIKEEKKQLKIRVDEYNKRLISNPLLLKPYNNPVYKTASRKRTLLMEWVTDRSLPIYKKVAEAGDSINKWKAEYNEIYRNTVDCEARKGLATSFLSKANTLWQQRNSELMTFQKEILNAEARLAWYANADRSLYELELASIKEAFLGLLGNLRCEYEVGCMLTEPDKPAGKVLPDFDSVNCTYHQKIFIPPFTTMEFECNKMTTNFKLGIDFNYGPEVSPYIKFGFTENLTNNTTITPSNITKATVEVGAETGSGKILSGMQEAEAKAEGGIGIEFTPEGVESVYVKVGAKVDVGPAVEEGVSSYDNVAGVETELSWNAGSEKTGSYLEGKFAGKGILSGIHISTGPIR